MSPHTPSCGECGGPLYVDRDETLCGDCGLIVATDRIDPGPEWRSFPDSPTNPERTGAPLTPARHDRGLSTEIGYGGGLSETRRRQFIRLRRQHNRARIRTKREWNQLYGFTEIRRITVDQSLPTSVRDQACELFRTAQNEGLFRGRSLEGFAAATVYAICRINGLSRTIEEIVLTARADRAELQVAYDALNRDLGLPVGPTPPVEYLPRFASHLDVPSPVEHRARDLARQAEQLGLANGRNPCGIAAACLYTAAVEGGVNLTQQEVAAVASVTPVTLRNTFQALVEQAE